VTVETVIAVASSAGVAVTALITAIVVARMVVDPWRKLVEETARRAKAEGDARFHETEARRVAEASAQKDEQIDALRDEIARHLARPIPAGFGTVSLQAGAEEDDARRAGDDPGRGGDPAGPVPRVTSPGDVTGGASIPGGPEGVPERGHRDEPTLPGAPGVAGRRARR